MKEQSPFKMVLSGLNARGDFTRDRARARNDMEKEVKRIILSVEGDLEPLR